MFEINAQGQKFQNDKVAIFYQIAILAFVPVHRFQKFFWPNDFSLSPVIDLLRNLVKKVLQALSKDIHVLIREDKLNDFKHPS